MLTVTQASPAVDQDFPVEKDSSQLLLPSSISATSDGNTQSKTHRLGISLMIERMILASDSQDTSCESQPIKPRTKKQSRYPCRRAQRPVKQITPSDQVEKK